MILKNVRGFTLIEVLIVVAIISILAAIAVPSYEYAMRKSRRADAKVALSGLAQAQETFYTDRRTYASNLGTATSANTIRCQSFCKMDGTTVVSPDGYYALTIAARSGGTIATGFVLTATARGVQLKDTECQTFTLDSINNKGATDGGGSSNDSCW